MLKSVEKANEIIGHRYEMAEQAKAEGRTVVGHYCCSVPRELLTAAGVLPFRITGDVKQSPTDVDRVLETNMCPFLRSTVDMGLKGRYDFLDALIIPHACECTEKIYDVWPHYVKAIKNMFFIDVPHMTYDSSYDFYGEILKAFIRDFEKRMGATITEEKLSSAIALHNENRRLLKKLNDMRAKEPSPISATEMHSLLFAGFFMDVEAHNELIRRAIEEVSQVKAEPSSKPKVMLFTSELDDPMLLELIEECGGEIVTDDMCMGTRSFNFQVEENSDDPVLALAKGYLYGIRCPRTYRQGSLDDRFSHITELAKAFGATGLIIYVIRFCDTHAYDAPLIRKYAEENGLSVLQLEDEYRIENSKGQLKTRIQAFIEML